MNKLGYTLLAIAVLVVGAVGLGIYILWPTSNTPVDVEAPSPTSPGTYEDTGTYYTVTGNYPATLSLTEDADARAVAVLKAYVENEGKNFVKETGVNTLTEEDIRVQNLGGERVYELKTTYEVFTSENTVSVVFLSYVDTLGAHPNAYYRTFTFDTSTGAEISLKDLFADTEDYLTFLSTLSKEKLISQIAALTDTPLEELSTEQIEAGTTPRAENFAWFYLTDNELVLIFPPYQVGPWALGTQEVHLARSTLGI